MPTTAPYGSWKSPITTDLVVAGVIGLGQIALDDEDIYWMEMRPSEEGRMVVVKRNSAGEVTDITPKPFSARTKVHEYGGGEYIVYDGVVYFTNFPINAFTGRMMAENPWRLRLTSMCVTRMDASITLGIVSSVSERIIPVEENQRTQ